MNPGTRNDHIRRVRRVSEFIRNNLDEELTLDKLSREAHFSPFHFHRIFNAVVGESVMAHIRRLRLERAARHLKKTRWPVIRIALDAGYETPEAFCRAFKTLTGLSPSSFRKAIQQTPGNDLGGPEKFSFHDEIKQDLPSIERNDMDIKIENWEPRKVAFVRHLGPYQECGTAWDRLCTWAAPKGLLAGGPEMFGISYDDPETTPPEKIRYDACLRVEDDIEPGEDIGLQEIAGGTYVVATHEGPYSDFNQTYSYLYADYIPSTQWECRDAPCVEIYLNDPNSTPPEDLVSLVCIPVTKQPSREVSG